MTGPAISGTAFATNAQGSSRIVVTQPSGYSTAGPVAVALTGASGMPYALRLIECLVGASVELFVMVSKAARSVLAWEMDIALPGQTQLARQFLTERFRAQPGQIHVFAQEEWTAPTASGSSVPRAMVVCPCSMGTLAAIAHGTSGRRRDQGTAAPNTGTARDAVIGHSPPQHAGARGSRCGDSGGQSRLLSPTTDCR